MSSLTILLLLGCAFGVSRGRSTQASKPTSCPPSIKRLCPEGEYRNECGIKSPCRGNLICCPDYCGTRCRCPELACPKHKCEFGFATDDRGCQRCQCYDPCEGRCKPGEVCQQVVCVTEPCPALCVAKP